MAPAKPLEEGFEMRNAPFNNPFLLGFDHLEKVLERSAKSAGDGYPPYNIEESGPDGLRITLAVAGFGDSDLSVTAEENQLIIRGRRSESAERTFLHKGIATRQFQRTFVLAEGIEVVCAELKNGLLAIDLARPKTHTEVKKIEIRTNRSGLKKAT